MKKYKSALKNLFICSLFFLYKPFKKIKPSNRILIITTTGLGDTLWATPAIKKIFEKYPDKKISVLTNTLGAEIFQNNPYIEKIYIWKKPLFSSFFSMLSLRKDSFDKIFVFHASQRIVFLLLGFLKSKEIIGTKGINKEMDFLFSKLVKNKKIHEVHRRLELDSLDTRNLTIDFFLTSEEKNKAKKTLISLGINPSIPLITLHPGAKDRYKCYPVSRFCKLANNIKGPVQFLLSGLNNEKDLIEKLQKNLPHSIHIENLSLREYAALLSESSLLITNDTGPMHLACGLDIPIIGLFSPTNPKLCGPISTKANVFYKKKCCDNCLKRKCLDPFCLLQIPTHVIVQKVQAIITNSYKKEKCLQK